MKLCKNYDDGTYCIYCGYCGMELCREHSNPNQPCTHCGYCEEGGIIVNEY